MQETIGWIGLGSMGHRMSRHLGNAGYPLLVADAASTERAPKGANIAKTNAEVAARAATIFLSLPDGVVSQTVARELATAPNRKAKTVIDTSTIGIEAAQACSTLLAASGIEYIDAPVSGGTVGAAQGTLAIMAGGLAEDLESVAPVFQALGTVTHVGPHGRGQLCKLVNQTIVAVTIGAVAEGMVLAKAGGADPAQVRKAILGGFCQSRILEEHGQRMIDRNFVPGGAVRNQLKDLDAVLEVARKVGVHLPLTERVRDQFAALARSGKEDLDHSALILQVEAE